MEIFTCDSCFKVFKHKGNYKAHLRRLTQCGIPSDYIAMSEPNELSCSICFKEFVNKHSRIRHEKTTVCSLKIEKAQKENAKIKELEETAKEAIAKNKMLEEQLEKMKGTTTNNTTTTNTTTTTNSHNTNNIIINFHGKEDISHITDKQYMYILNRGFKSLKEYVHKKYFSDDMPSNANIYSSDFKSKYLYVFDMAAKWVLKDKRDVLEKMYDDNYFELHSKYMDLQMEYKLKTPQFENFVKKYEDEIIKKGIVEDIKLVLFNERDKSLKNKKQTCC